MAKFDDEWHQIPDDRPVEVALRLNRPLTLQERIKRFVREELSQEADANGFDSFDEANDFDIPGDDTPEVITTHEIRGMSDEELLTFAESRGIMVSTTKKGDTDGSVNPARGEDRSLRPGDVGKSDGQSGEQKSVASVAAKRSGSESSGSSGVGEV